MVRLWLTLLAAVLTGCGRTASDGAKKKITITGASTIAPLAGEIGKRFEELHPGVRVDVQTGGSARGVSDTRQGLNDVGMVSRPLKDDEKDLYAFGIARDGVTVILHKDNPVTSLSDEQIIGIYKGTITDWSAVGGHAGKITVVNKAEGRSTLELFCQHFKLKNSEIKAHSVIGDNEQGIKQVAGNANAIGYVSIGTAEYDAAHGSPIKLLPIGGIAATSEMVLNGKFPLARPLNFVIKDPPVGIVKEFLDFAVSEKVHDLIREQSFVPLPK